MTKIYKSRFKENSHGHYITVCKECGIRMGQCRCSSENKEIKYSLCMKCGGVDPLADLRGINND